MDVLQLLNLLADGGFHSGESLGARLGISRAAVWKQVRELRALGVEVHAVTGKGYRLPEKLELLDRSAIISMSRYADELLGERFFLHTSIDSTNAQAMRLVDEGEARCLVMAEHQTRGRGRRGRPWVSPLGHNLYLSLAWPFQQGVAALEGLSLVCALMVVRALEQLGLEGAGVKWPNDVLIDGSKLAGILLEVQGDVAGPCTVVMGIGVNTDMPAAAAAEIDQAFSDLVRMTGASANRNRVAAVLVDALLEGVRQFEQEGFRRFRAPWQERDVYAGSRVEVHSGGQSLTGTVDGVNESGRLVLETGSGRRLISGGEVFPSLRPLAAHEEPGL